jgi:hypothetical protein
MRDLDSAHSGGEGALVEVLVLGGGAMQVDVLSHCDVGACTQRFTLRHNPSGCKRALASMKGGDGLQKSVSPTRYCRSAGEPAGQ